MELEIGKEYTEVDINFLTGLPWRENKVTYCGRNPYDGRHVFMSEYGGSLLVPDNGQYLSKLR